MRYVCISGVLDKRLLISPLPVGGFAVLLAPPLLAPWPARCMWSPTLMLLALFHCTLLPSPVLAALMPCAPPALATGKLMNIQDAYNHPLFSPVIDKLTGYITRSILCCAIRDMSGKSVAVLQVRCWRRLDAPCLGGGGACSLTPAAQVGVSLGRRRAGRVGSDSIAAELHRHPASRALAQPGTGEHSHQQKRFATGQEVNIIPVCQQR